MLEPYSRIQAGTLDFTGSSAEFFPDPVAIGAVGGSGTRLMAKIVDQVGIAMATPMNESADALEWPPLRNLLQPELLSRFSRRDILMNAFNSFERLLVLRRHGLGLEGRVGWKVPGTHLWLEELAAYFPAMQYIHLVRNGLDMAYSENQNQVINWGESQGMELEYDDEGRASPASVMEYWLRANEDALETGRRCLGERMLVVHYERLCAEPRDEISRIGNFLGVALGDDKLKALSGLVRPAASIARYRRHDWQRDFSDGQLLRLEKLGYRPGGD